MEWSPSVIGVLNYSSTIDSFTLISGILSTLISHISTH